MSSAEDMNPLSVSTPAGPSDPQPEEFPVEMEEAAPLQPSPKLALKTNMVAQEVRVKATGAHPGKTAGVQEPFTEETTSVLVCETGGVIRLSAAVVPGQLLFLINQESKREVVAQVLRKRADRPTSCYVELEFAEPAPKFWGTEFSAAAALLPKGARGAEIAALVISAEATADEPGGPPPAASAEEVQALKRQIEVQREQPKVMQAPLASEQTLPLTSPPASVVAPEASLPPVAGPPVVGNAASTPPSGGSDESLGVANTLTSPPLEHDPGPAPLTTAEQTLPPKPSLDFNMLLTKAKRRPRARGNFTPGGALRLALLTAMLVITAIGAAWYKHWIPWQPAARKPSVTVLANPVNARAVTQPGGSEAVEGRPESSDAKAASDTPALSPGTPSDSATLSKTPPPEAADATESAEQPSESGESEARPVARKTPPSTTLAVKHSPVVPAASAASNAVVSSGAEGVIVPPKLIKSVRAEAPIEAVRDFETGNVVIDAVVGTAGEVTSMNVLSGPPSLRDSAMETLKQYRYEPATRNGQPVPTHVTVTIHFRFER